MKNINPINTRSWKILKDHFNMIKDVHMSDLFNEDQLRFQKFSILFNGQILVDFSKNRIIDSTIKKLLNLAKEIDLQSAIKSMFNGNKINVTENRAVLHTALRNKINNPIYHDNKDIMLDISSVLKKMEIFSDSIINGNWKGFTGKSITDVVNIGIGGSDLGPLMVIEALKPYRNHLNFHFISNVDGSCIFDLLKRINIETTIFLIVSKSFDTQETMMNACTIKHWIYKKFSNKQILDKHFFAITTNKQSAIDFGIQLHNIFMFWNWVGGRFSIWSAVGLSIVLAIGFKNFQLFLKGAYMMDQHYLNTDWHINIPVILALINVWYSNFFHAETEAVLAYDQNMYRFSSFLQQTNMESNGKSVDRNNNFVTWQTGPIIWGEPGTNGQHAFYQLLHQGTKLIPCDFIASIMPHHPLMQHHKRLLSHFFAQTRALAFGTSSTSIDLNKVNSNDTTFDHISIHKLCIGNKPSNSILLRQLNPYNLGSLIALYEHKVFTQGVILNIFSFDQWGVQLGKSMSESMFTSIESDFKNHQYDSSTNGLINFYKRYRTLDTNS